MIQICDRSMSTYNEIKINVSKSRSQSKQHHQQTKTCHDIFDSIRRRFDTNKVTIEFKSDNVTTISKQAFTEEETMEILNKQMNPIYDDLETNEQLAAKNKCNRIDSFISISDSQLPTDTEYKLNDFESLDHHSKQLRIHFRSFAVRFEPEIEPFFLSIALFDLQSRSKISENFYFHNNCERLCKLLPEEYRPKRLTTSAVFTIPHDYKNLHFIIRIEKVLQQGGDNCLDAYLKVDYKQLNRHSDNANNFVKRMGKYRMAVGWINISLATLLHESNPLMCHSKSTSLDRRSRTFAPTYGNRPRTREESIARLPSHSLLHNTTLEDSIFRKSQSISAGSDGQFDLSKLKATVITLSKIYRQDIDKLSDIELIKHLCDGRRGSATRRLRILPAFLKFEFKLYVNASADKHIKNVPNLFMDERPFSEYRNELYFYPKRISSIACSRVSTNFRNITVRIQFMVTTENGTTEAIPQIYSKYSNSMLSKVYLPIFYHHRSPSFYDEIKIEVPARTNNGMHLLFTFFHVSCQRKDNHEPPLESVIGYSWICIDSFIKNRIANISLPIAFELTENYYTNQATAENTLIRWIDNGRSLFSFHSIFISTIHPKNHIIEEFLTIPQHSICSGDQTTNILEGLINADINELVNFLYAIIDRLVVLLCKHSDRLRIFNIFVRLLDRLCESNGITQSNSSPAVTSLNTYINERSIFADRFKSFSKKKIYESIISSWKLSDDATQVITMNNTRFLFELTIKSLILETWYQFGGCNVEVPIAISSSFETDLSILIAMISSRCIQCSDTKIRERLNKSVSYFLYGLMQILNQNTVSNLIYIYFEKLEGSVNLNTECLTIICSNPAIMELNKSTITQQCTNGFIILKLRESFFKEQSKVATITTLNILTCMLYTQERLARSTTQSALTDIAQSIFDLVVDIFNEITVANEEKDTVKIGVEPTQMCDLDPNTDKNVMKSALTLQLWVFKYIDSNVLFDKLTSLCFCNKIHVISFAAETAISIFEFNSNKYKAKRNADTDGNDLNKTDISLHRNAHFSHESSLIVIDLLTVLIKVFRTSTTNVTQSLLHDIFRINAKLLCTTQSSHVYLSAMMLLKSISGEFIDLYANDEIPNFAHELFYNLLFLCARRNSILRECAVSLIVQILLHNYKIDDKFVFTKYLLLTPISTLDKQLSSINQRNSLCFSLNEIISQCEQHKDLRRNSFSFRVKEFVCKLITILKDTYRLQNCSSDLDNEYKLDLMHRIADCYSAFPDQRLMWLQIIAQHQLQMSRYIEAGLCLLHAAAIIAEYLAMGNHAILNGCVDLKLISINVLEESAISDDIFVDKDVCNWKTCTESGFIGFMEQAAMFFVHVNANAFELANKVHKTLATLFDYQNDQQRLAATFGKMQDYCGRLACQKTEPRVPKQEYRNQKYPYQEYPNKEYLNQDKRVLEKLEDLDERIAISEQRRVFRGTFRRDESNFTGQTST
ncbi:hypothetical protein GJ496_000784 [Pomphorhynchus laevis]|nr:hypothetical protein GJ496_000784 [Pomphorhynchus laevis]